MNSTVSAVSASGRVACRRVALFLMLRFGRPHNHPSDVYCVRACQVDAAADLLAVGGELFVEILRQVSCAMP